MMEETNKWDGGGRGEKRRRHDDKLEAVAAELAWRPAVAACSGGSSSSSSGGSGSGSGSGSAVQIWIASILLMNSLRE